jgi:hypothetical protein
MEAPKPFTQRPTSTLTAVDLDSRETTITLEEWHRQRDRRDETQIVVLHQPELLPLAS